MKTRWFASVVTLAAIFLMFSACGDDAEYEHDYSDEDNYTYEIRFDTTDDLAMGGYGDAVVPVSEFQRMWTVDIELMRQHVLSTHPYFTNPAMSNTPAVIVTRQVFNAQIDSLLHQLPNITEFEIAVALQRALAVFQSTAFYFPPFLEHLMHGFIMQFLWVGSGLYLIAGCENSAHALGNRLVAVNGVSIEDITEATRWLLGGENSYAVRRIMGFVASSPALFDALGFGIADGNVVIYSFMRRDGSTFDLYKHIVQAQAWMDLWGVWNDVWITLTMDSNALPQWDSHNMVWHEHWYENDANILYIRIQNNTVLPIPGYNNIRRILRSGSLHGTIIDLRNTTYFAGNLSTVVLQLLNDAVRYTPPDAFFVLIDEYTQILELVLYLESIGATIVGEPPALPLRHLTITNASAADHTLMGYSQMSVIVPNHIVDTNRHGVTRDFPGGLLMPHVLIEPTIDDRINGNDPWIHYVLMKILEQ